ncbi:thymidylate synthase [Nocardia sp. NPDC059246]|uniref:thymidylate synthase n=1 Tax=unclassified Nocardia TaxID=2637762 RepID=UPI003695DDC4
MLVLTAPSANQLYTATCRAVLDTGLPVSPRGMATTEVLGAHLCLTDPRRRFIDVGPRRLNPAFAVAEALWILSGSDEPWIYRYNQALTQFSDDGILQGAYGPRMRDWHGIDQLEHVLALLQRDPDTRQAVIQLYDPARDTRGHRDVPCTLNYRFQLRRGRLRMQTTMRSQDLWLGLPYDLFAATVLHELMAGWLGAELGDYHHHIDSLHLYQQHTGPAHNLPAIPPPCDQMPAVAVEWPHLATTVADTVNNWTAELPQPWASFAAILASYRDWTSGHRDRARTSLRGVDDPLARALERWYDHLSTHPRRTEISS